MDTEEKPKRLSHKSLWKYKHDCHALLDKIWGSHKRGQAQAYAWMRKEYGKEIHFSQINEISTLQAIKDRLLKYSVLERPLEFMIGSEPHIEYERWNRRTKTKMRKNRRLNSFAE